jgi:hypothetical protein
MSYFGCGIRKRLQNGYPVLSQRSICSTLQMNGGKFIRKMYTSPYIDRRYFIGHKTPNDQQKFTSLSFRQIFTSVLRPIPLRLSTNDMRSFTFWDAAVMCLIAIGISVGMTQQNPSQNLLLHDTSGNNDDETVSSNDLNGVSGIVGRVKTGVYTSMSILSASPMQQENGYYENSLKGDVDLGFHQPRLIQGHVAPPQETFLRRDTHQSSQPYDVSFCPLGFASSFHKCTYFSYKHI